MSNADSDSGPRLNLRPGASASPPDHILPTPAQSPRPRPAKRPRLHAKQTERESSPQPPLSALQRLSIARKEAGAGRSPSPAAASSSPAGGSMSSPTPRTGVTPRGDASASGEAKPMSKLALLAQKRKEAAQTASTSAASSASPSALPSRVVTPAPSGSSPAAAGPSSAASPAKPLSKLAQKMAAARAAKAEAATQAAADQDRGGTGAASNADSTPTDNVPPEPMDVDPTTSLFPTSTPQAVALHAAPDQAHGPSPFFSLLTSTSASPKSSPPVESDSGQILHLPFVRDQAGLERRVREAFGAADSPDDIVLRARQGRAGTATLSTTATTAGAGAKGKVAV